MRRHIWRDLDHTLVFCTIALVLLGITVIGSATHINKVGFTFTDLVSKQILFFVINGILVIAMQWFDYRKLEHWSKGLYGLTLVLLLAVMFVGTSALGAQRWIQVGPLTIQPSEFTKLFMIVCLATFLLPRINQLRTFKSLVPVFIYVGIPTLLVFKQPDLGTSLVYMAIMCGMLFIAGIRMRLVEIMLGAMVLIAPLGWFALQSYQKERILVFLNPNIDPFGAGYHIIQSKIAIGSGLIFGKGLFEGTQSQLNFLPENHTDFIFSVIGEELGFIGCVIALILLFLLIYRALIIAKNATDPFGMMVATGIASMWAFEVLINVGMTTGIMPVTGIPLPFISYGVSALTTNLLSVGLLLNISLRQKKFMFNQIET